MKGIRFKKRALASGLLVAGLTCSLSAQAEPGGIPLGGMQLVPSLGLSYKHNDNIFSSETATKSSHISVVNPKLSLQASNQKTSLELTYALEKAIYHSSRNDDYLDHFIDMNVSAELSDRLQTSLTLGYSKEHDARGSTDGASAATPDKYHQTSVSATVGYGLRGRVDVEGDYSRKRFYTNVVNTQGRDVDTAGAGISFSFPIMKKTKAVIEARYKKFDYILQTATTNLDSAEQRYFGGLDWEATARTSGRLRLGYMRKNFDSATLSSGPQTANFSWELGVTWDPTTYSSVSLDAKSSIDETTGVGSHIETQGGTLGWNHQWNDKLTHAINSGYTQKDYIGQATSRQDKLYTAGLSLDYQFQRWLKVGLSYDYSKNQSNDAGSSYKTNTEMLNFLLTL